MKNILIALILISGIVSISFNAEHKKADEPVIASKSLALAAIIVKDIDVARNARADASKNLGCILEVLENYN
jgi:hypothetical protein